MVTPYAGAAMTSALGIGSRRSQRRTPEHAQDELPTGTAELAARRHDAVVSGARPERSPSVDGLRGAAVLLVLGLHSHVALFASGGLGVDMFFVISGFLITNLLLDERRRTVGSPRFYAAFLARRAGRLVPGLLLSVAVVVAWSWVVDKRSSHCTLLSLTHSMNIPGLGGDRCAGPWHVTWSLAAEEQFYVLWPVLLFFLIRRLPLRRAGQLVLGLWALSGGAIVAASVWRLAPASQLNYAPWGRSLAVLAGCALAERSRSPGQLPRSAER